MRKPGVRGFYVLIVCVAVPFVLSGFYYSWFPERELVYEGRIYYVDSFTLVFEDGVIFTHYADSRARAREFETNATICGRSNACVEWDCPWICTGIQPAKYSKCRLERQYVYIGFFLRLERPNLYLKPKWEMISIA